MVFLEGSGVPVLYIGRMVLKGRLSQPVSFVNDRYKLVNTHVFFTAIIHTQTRVGT
jgi:hypothetical protein